jgi:hypothetical protein
MYVGPEVLMPLASVLAAITGVLLLFWKKTVAVVRSGYSFVHRTVSSLFRRP